MDDVIPGVDELEVSGAPKANKKSKGNPENRPIMFADPYSPSIKAKKIDNMRKECISKMGERNFDKVYKYLQKVCSE